MSVAQSGATTQVSQRITQDQIRRFAAVTGDDNPLHTDDEYAENGLFDGPIAHGMLAAGVISSALADLPGEIVYVSQNLSFDAPVYPGQTVTATAEVTDELGENRIQVETTAAVEETTVVSGEAVVLSLERD